MAAIEVVAPSGHKEVQLPSELLFVLDMSDCLCSNGTHRLPEALRRVSRREEVSHLSDPPEVKTPEEVKREEVEPLPRSRYPRPLLVQPETKLREEGFQDALDALCIAVVCEHDDDVVGISHHLRVVRVSPIRFKSTLPSVELVQVDVGQERGDDASLRSPLLRMGHLVQIDDSRPEPLTDELVDVWVRNPLPDKGEEPVMVDVVEEAFDV